MVGRREGTEYLTVQLREEGVVVVTEEEVMMTKEHEAHNQLVADGCQN